MGDQFSLYGFSSRRRGPIRVHFFVRFDETYQSSIRGRVAAIKPGYYACVGVVIRLCHDGVTMHRDQITFKQNDPAV